MKPEKLMEVIGDIDDSFIEESALRRRKLFGGNWGLVASAACLCLVIGGVVLLHDLGWRPDFPGLSHNAKPPAITDPTETDQPTMPETQPIETTPDPQLQALLDILGDQKSWYNRALTCEFDNPAQLKLHNLFYCGFPGESRKPTAEEWEQLEDKQGFNENYDLMRLPENKMNQILVEYFGITLDDIPEEGFSGLTYLESTDCWYFMTTGWLGIEKLQVLSVETMENGVIHVCYNADYWGVYDLMLQPYGDGYRVLSNVRQGHLEKINQLFSEEGSWYNLALASLYDTPQKVGLRYFFLNGLEDESREPTQQEREALGNDTVVDLDQDLIRLPISKMNEQLLTYFGIRAELMDQGSGAFAGMTYLESTGCWYLSTVGTMSVRGFTAHSMEWSANGTLLVYYSTGWGSAPTHILALQPNYNGYMILSNCKIS